MGRYAVKGWLRETLSATPVRLYFTALAAYLVWLLVHFGVRHLAARSLLGGRTTRPTARRARQPQGGLPYQPKPWRSIFSRHPAGWTRRSRRHIQQALEDADRYVQDLNDRFTNPSGNPPLELSPEQIDDVEEELAMREPARTAAAD